MAREKEVPRATDKVEAVQSLFASKGLIAASRVTQEDE